MKRYKWHFILTLGLALVLISSVAACTKPKETPYAPDFTLQTISDETVSLSDFRGKPVMLTFWKINCAACQFQMPYTQAFYDEQSGETIAVLTINVGDSASAAQDYVTSRKLTFPVLLDRQGKVAQMYGLPGVPMTFLIDSEGIVKAYKIGAFQSQKEMESAIESVFPSLTLKPKIETGPEIGNLAPDFTLQTINGQSITLNESRGKTVLLNFWVNSCAACVDEMPYFQTVSDEQANKELVVLAINCGESSQTVKNIVDGLKLTFPMLLDPDGKVCTAYKHGAPTTFLIDSNGIIRAIKDDAFQNPEEIESMLNSLP
ncbi:MAG: TlpA disulfide reductase family protein [Dehalococcoidia bacterium]